MPMNHKKLPSAESITDLIIQGFPEDNRITPERFHKRFSTAAPIKPDNPDGWHYAPLCSGSFKGRNRHYVFTLFLGGRGWLIYPGGRKVFFSFRAED